MIRCVVDTNVAIVANGRPNEEGAQNPTIECRRASVTLLTRLVKDGQVLLDLAGEIQAEYRRHLHPSGAPGVGDRFYQEVLRSSPLIVERVYLPRRPDGEYVDVPQTVIECGFDPSDRKFVALAHRENVPVFISTDTDYVEHQVVLSASGIQVSYLCGCDPARWFE
jgi:hypothetical protein